MLKAMAYGCETWSPTKAEETTLAVTEKAVERRIFGASLRNHDNNHTLCQMSDVKDKVVKSVGWDTLRTLLTAGRRVVSAKKKTFQLTSKDMTHVRGDNGSRPETNDSGQIYLEQLCLTCSCISITSSSPH